MDQYQRALLEELLLRERQKLTPSKLFKQQRAFVEDPARYKAALCTRRAGKSHGAGHGLFAAGKKHPKSLCPYLALTRDSAKNIMWPTLLELIEEHEIDCEPRESALEVDLDNGSRIKLYGADQERYIQRLRGPKYPIFVVDEAQAFGPHIEELILDVVAPALTDLKGECWLLGTPGPTPHGFFYNVTTGKSGFSVHKWSIFDNPHIPHAKEELELILKQFNLTLESPKVRREWFGEWAQDFDSLVYRYSEKNLVTELPKDKWHFIIGIDFGWNDETAFAVLAYRAGHPQTYVIKTFKQAKMNITQIADKLNEIKKEYPPVKIVADTGGLGKTIVEEMNARHRFGIEAATKTEKMANIALMNAAFADSHMLVLDSCQDLIHEYLNLTKMDEVEDPSFPNHLADAVLYAWRSSPSFVWRHKPKVVPQKSMEEKLLEAELASFEQKKWRKRVHGY